MLWNLFFHQFEVRSWVWVLNMYLSASSCAVSPYWSHWGRRYCVVNKQAHITTSFVCLFVCVSCNIFTWPEKRRALSEWWECSLGAWRRWGQGLVCTSKPELPCLTWDVYPSVCWSWSSAQRPLILALEINLPSCSVLLLLGLLTRLCEHEPSPCSCLSITADRSGHCHHPCTRRDVTVFVCAVVALGIQVVLPLGANPSLLLHGRWTHIRDTEWPFGNGR